MPTRRDLIAGLAVAALCPWRVLSNTYTTTPLAPDRVTQLLGPINPVLDVEGWGGDFLRYETDFRRYSEYHWAATGISWDKDYGNYYDRAKIYYAWWARTGNLIYLNRAHDMAVNYRTYYVEKQDYAVADYWSMPTGIALHHLCTGDERSRLAVGRMADRFTEAYWWDHIGNSRSLHMDGRGQARCLEAFLLAWYLDAPSSRGNDWSARVRDAATKILSTQNKAGAYQWAVHCGAEKPFMTGMVNDALAMYAQIFAPQDGRIAIAIQRSVDYLWAYCWIENRKAMRYVEMPCSSTGEMPVPAVDLNNMISASFGYVYQNTRDATYRDRGDAMFFAAVRAAYLRGGKQFNQQYASSYKYLAYRSS
jgi:hypothetical protein